MTFQVFNNGIWSGDDGNLPEENLDLLNGSKCSYRSLVCKNDIFLLLDSSSDLTAYTESEDPQKLRQCFVAYLSYSIKNVLG